MAQWNMVTGNGGAGLVRRGTGVPTSPLVSICLLVLSDPTLALGCLDALAAPGGGTRPDRDGGRRQRHVGSRPDRSWKSATTSCWCAVGPISASPEATTWPSEIARGRYLFFVNDDSMVAPDCISQLMATAELDQTIGAVGSRILSADGSLQEAGSVLWDDGSTERVGFGLPAGTLRYSYVRDVDFMSANGLMVRRAAWNAVGGFDERFFPAYYEDVDLCMAMREHGYRVVYEPRARLHHLESQSTSTRFRKFLLARNRKQFVAKWKAELPAFGERPEDIDESGMERSIGRARGSPRRLLMVARGVGEGSGGVPWDAVESSGCPRLGDHRRVAGSGRRARLRPRSVRMGRPDGRSRSRSARRCRRGSDHRRHRLGRGRRHRHHTVAAADHPARWN